LELGLSEGGADFPSFARVLGLRGGTGLSVRRSGVS